MARFRPWLVLLIVCARSAPSGAVADSHDQAGDATADKLERVTLQLNWYPEAEHGGYYAALVAGYYRDAGLDVQILPGGPNVPVIQEVATDRVMFGIANADNVLFARAQQAPVVALLAPLQTSPRCLIVHAGAGIQSFDDLHDMTIAVTPGAGFVKFLRYKVTLKDVQFVPYTSLEGFLRDHESPARLRVQRALRGPAERGRSAGPDAVGLGFQSLHQHVDHGRARIAGQSGLVRRMVAASVKGWEDYLRDPQPANKRIHEQNPAMDLEALDFGAKAVAPLVLTDESRERRAGHHDPGPLAGPHRPACRVGSIGGRQGRSAESLYRRVSADSGEAIKKLNNTRAHNWNSVLTAGSPLAYILADRSTAPPQPSGR